ncbi:MAG: 30S ribosomal protein S6 [Omnitrophica bacterium RBG_13_46_9]|nr:MAG: 30S ribosomal protein S6 [Omnitrophica bacterium RBG_13_46_9]
MNEYDGLFIIDPTKEKSLKEVTEGISGAVLKSNGKINKEENWGKQKLNYQIKKNTEGIYYKLNFSMDPSAISALKNTYKLNMNILRAMITRA